MSVVRFRPGPPRILRTLEVVRRISSVGRGLAPFPLGFPNSPRLESSFKRTVYELGICHPCAGQCRLNRRSSRVGARNVVLNDNRNPCEGIGEKPNYEGTSLTEVLEVIK